MLRIKDKRMQYAFIGLFLIFLTLSIASYMKPASFERRVLVESVVEEGVLTHTAHFTNSTIYGSYASLEYYPTKVTDYILGEYKYRIIPKEEGNYTLEGITSYYVTKGKEKIYLLNETTFRYTGNLTNGRFMQDFKVNLTKINGREAEISKALNLPRLSYELTVIARVKRGNGTFTQEMPVVNDAASGLTYIENTEEKKVNNKVKTINENLEFLGMPVSRARILFPVLTLIFGILTPVTWEPRKKKWKAIEGRPTGIGQRVIVEDMKSLKKVSSIVGSPIIHYETDGIDIYGVIDGNVLYEYWELRKSGP